MKIIKRDSELKTKDIYLENDGKELLIFFAGNGDLYWVIKTNNQENYESFKITKENYSVYSLFENLYSDIESINVHNSVPCYITIYEEYLKELDEEKEMYIKYNYSNYNELFNKEEKKITWYSDEVMHDAANILTIKKLEEEYLIEFRAQECDDNFEKEDNLMGIGVRIRNSGSRYNPFNVLFMKMFNNLQNIDDVNDLYHQYHIEEYLYKEKIKKK